MVREFLFIFVLAVFATLASDCGNSNPQPNPQPNTHLTVVSSVPINPSTIQGMENSLLQLFSEVRARGYTQYLSLSDYKVIVRNDCQPAPESGVMSWQEYVPGYGVIWQAERVEISNGAVQSFQICNDIPQNMFNTTRYGAEHLILYFNDRIEFERTKIHSTPELSHPIIK